MLNRKSRPRQPSQTGAVAKNRFCKTLESVLRCPLAQKKRKKKLGNIFPNGRPRDPLLDTLGGDMPTQLNLMQGTLDMLILKAVSLGPLHGYGVLLRIQQISGGQLAIQQGSLYPALFRLEHQGLIASEWGESDNKRRAKFYRLTASGRSRLRAEADNWNRMASLIAGILNTTPEEI